MRKGKLFSKDRHFRRVATFGIFTPLKFYRYFVTLGTSRYNFASLCMFTAILCIAVHFIATKRACLKKPQSTNMYNYFVVKEKQQGLPGSTVHWIIAGVTIGFCVVLLLVAAVALKRRSRGLFTPNYTD